MIPQLAGLLKPRDIKPETTYDVILKAYLENKIDELPEDQQKMLERWKKADSLLRSGELVKKGNNEITRPYNISRLTDYLVSHYKVSVRTARADIAHAKRFFLSTYDRDEKEYARGVMIEWGEELFFEARSMGDYKAAAAIFKTLSEIKGIYNDDPDLPDYSKIQIPQLVIVDDPSELGFEKVENVEEVVASILAKRKKNKLDKLIESTEIIEPEDGDGD
ncbi:hypothetical protein BDE36_1779 [Arcticibacter tournemirensis]|uniref:Uncharacterized protein n=1 Tax=Arcticibacter tournemirensis TaxID=699437 RepID=A0A5M9HFR0_9SPHI|nr:hypothetical protein [Arcticibacter tournemirensis]KAA8483757.1 hypothetical protein F1649_07665 [Arcticibacter tournemirensis]TQM50044.1 hypothetical protein BDE36_1779 [Arcticibacter tournemirensis]